MDGFVSSDGWAAVPYGNQYMIIYGGRQISVHKTLDKAKEAIKVNRSKIKQKGQRRVARASKIKGLEEFMS